MPHQLCSRPWTVDRNQYSVPAEYVGKDVAVVALDNMLAAYYEGKQIALHRISYQKKDMVVNALPQAHSQTVH